MPLTLVHRRSSQDRPTSGTQQARAEPKTLRYRILHAAARLVCGGPRRELKIAAAWPWAGAITAAWTRITALAQAP